MSMKITLDAYGGIYEADLIRPIDISLPLIPDAQGPNCFYAPPFRTEPVRAGSFVGDIGQGGSVNFKNVWLNPHGNGTHTECYAHITRTEDSLQDCLTQYMVVARLITLYPTREDNGDRVIQRGQLEAVVVGEPFAGLVIRTMPNSPDKRVRNWSGSNPPYVSGDAAAFLADKGVQHLVLDLPSVDREEDGGALAAHRAFWGVPDRLRRHATITELAYIPDHVPDGVYLLNLQIASFVLDVSPSKPVLYTLHQVR
jgi:arylformamidase